MIQELKQHLQEHGPALAGWFKEKRAGLNLSLYASVDIRNSHHKISIVDTNAFPAGFNNLCRHDRHDLPDALRGWLKQYHPGARRLLLVPEAHTRNPPYLENVRALAQAFQAAGFELRIGTLLDAGPTQPIRLPALSGEIECFSLTRVGDRVRAGDFEPDLVISNNDFSIGIPEVLQGISQPMAPPGELGWHRRKKSDHFRRLHPLLAEFAELIGIAPGRLVPLTDHSAEADFETAAGREALARRVEALLERLREQTGEAAPPGEGEEPFVFIKDNSGTYGMAIMTVSSGDEVRRASHRTRTKMKLGKGRAPVNEVIIQEGIITRDSLAGCPMEPVIYLVGDRPVGGFFRVHCRRTDRQNLNVQGMTFNTLCFHEVEGQPQEVIDDQCGSPADLFLVYGTLGRIAAMALAMEISGVDT
jgi:glutamate--cysteine ligase